MIVPSIECWNQLLTFVFFAVILDIYINFKIEKARLQVTTKDPKLMVRVQQPTEKSTTTPINPLLPNY